MQRYQNVVLNTEGQPIVGASVTVKTLAGATASIFSDNSSTVAANPLTTDARGFFSFYAANGRYSLEITGADVSGTHAVSDILLDDETTETAVDGNLAFQGTGNRITGNFYDESSHLNRVLFTPDVANQKALVGVMPTSTSPSTDPAIRSGWNWYNRSDMANAQYGQASINQNAVLIRSAAFGGSSPLPIAFEMNTSEVARLSTAGLLTVGSAAGIDLPAGGLQVGTNPDSVSFSSTEANGGKTILVGNSVFGESARVSMSCITSALSVRSAHIVIDGQDNGALAIYQGGNEVARFHRTVSQMTVRPGSVTNPGIAASTDADSGIYWPAPEQLAIALGGAQIVAVTTGSLTANGQLVANDRLLVATYGSVGGTFSAGVTWYITGDAKTYGSIIDPNYSSAGSSIAVQGIEVRGETVAGSTYTVPAMYQFRAKNPTKGAGTVITNVYGVAVDDLTVGTNNYGALLGLTAGTGKWNIYASGSAANHMSGNLVLGSTVDSTGFKLQVTGQTQLTGALTVSTTAEVTGGIQVGTNPDSITFNSTSAEAGKTILIGNSTFGESARVALSCITSGASVRSASVVIDGQDNGAMVLYMGGSQWAKLDRTGNAILAYRKFGYGGGAGGSATQTGSRTASVTINAVNGQVTTDTASLAAGARAMFEVTNSSAADGDHATTVLQSTAQAGVFRVTPVCVASGKLLIEVENISTAASTVAAVINFAVFKGSST